jgi:HD-like signal output (HDOD) protein
VKLEEILGRNTLIPSLPVTVALLLQEFQKDEPDARTISAMLAGEIGLTIRILRLVNSASHGRGHQRIGSVEAATALVGLAAVRQFVNAAAVGGAFKKVPGVDMTAFWRYSLDVAKLAQSMAEPLGMDRGTAFTAGLLHGTGDLILKIAMPTRPSLQPAFESDVDRHRAQMADLGYSYAEVGAAFAAQWQFPDEIAEAIRHHCNPDEEEEPETLAGILYLASWSARAHELDIDGSALFDQFPHGVAEAIGFTEAGRLCGEAPIEWTGNDEAQDFA